MFTKIEWSRLRNNDQKEGKKSFFVVQTNALQKVLSKTAQTDLRRNSSYSNTIYVYKVQNGGISGPTKRTYILQIFFKKILIIAKKGKKCTKTTCCMDAAIVLNFKLSKRKVILLTKTGWSKFRNNVP